MGTTIQILAPLLTYELEVEVSASPGYCFGGRGIVRKLGWGTGNDGKPGNPALELAIVCLPQNNGACVSLTHMLPVLYAFADLPSVMIETNWGIRPASVVLARMITNLQVMPENVRLFGGSLTSQNYPGGPFREFINARTVESANLMYSVVEWLRSNHFAVGLTPGQYIRKGQSNG